MALFDPHSLNAGVRRREVFGWALYDFANSGYTTVVLTAVFNAYFVGVVAQGQDWGTLAWTSALAVSNFLVMATMPALGAFVDITGSKKRLLAGTTFGCVCCTAMLALSGPGDLWLAGSALVLSNVFYTYGESLIASYLPELAKPEAVGRVSGWGWSFGYVGGMLCLGVCLAYVLQAQARGEPAQAFVPVTLVICSELKVRRYPFLFAEIFASNSSSEGASAAARAQSAGAGEAAVRRRVPSGHRPVQHLLLRLLLCQRCRRGEGQGNGRVKCFVHAHSAAFLWRMMSLTGPSRPAGWGFKSLSPGSLGSIMALFGLFITEIVSWLAPLRS